MLLPSGNPIKCHEEDLSLQPVISHLNVLTFPPLTLGGCPEGLDAFRFFFKLRGCVHIFPQYVFMYGHTYSKSKGQPGKVANPARGQLNRKNEYFPVPVRA